MTRSTWACGLAVMKYSTGYSHLRHVTVPGTPTFGTWTGQLHLGSEVHACALYESEPQLSRCIQSEIHLYRTRYTKRDPFCILCEAYKATHTKQIHLYRTSNLHDCNVDVGFVLSISGFPLKPSPLRTVSAGLYTSYSPPRTADRRSSLPPSFLSLSVPPQAPKHNTCCPELPLHRHKLPFKCRFFISLFPRFHTLFSPCAHDDVRRNRNGLRR